ncbi:MAG: hypothetical protein AAF696_13615 [Bacteroidota bacterium]
MISTKKYNLHKLRITLFFLLCCLSTYSFGQEEKLSFPEAYLGEWEGKLEIYGPQGVLQRLDMELHIKELEGEGRWTWTIIYKGDIVDERKYELQLKDSAKAHYVIDEKNSIFLDAYFLGNTLMSRFSVNRSLLMINYTFEDEKIIFDVFSGSLDNTTKTGEEITEVEEIRAYTMASRQQAILQKKE